MAKLTKQEIQNWYNNKHKIFKEKTWRPYEAYPIFLNYLKAEEGKKLLDIGCGTGYLLKAAEEKGLIVYGIDISEEAVNIAKEIAKKSIITVNEAENLKFKDNLFDYITCLGSLEHFIDIEKAIKEILRVSKNDAVILIMVPNKDYIFWKFKKTKGTDQQEINEMLLDLKTWEKFLMKNGLLINKIYQDKWFMKEIKIFSSFNPYSVIKRIILKSIGKILPLKYAYQFIFICNKLS
jgi:ubiquinone/menaquinone biosynthesis C-methylase UbiE